MRDSLLVDANGGDIPVGVVERRRVIVDIVVTVGWAARRGIDASRTSPVTTYRDRQSRLIAIQ